MKILRISFLTLMIAALMVLPEYSLIAQEEETVNQLSPQDVFAKIPGLNEKVQANMAKCEEGIAAIAISIPRGDFKTIKETADQMGMKFSIEAALTDEELDVYSALISTDFILADQDLHQYLDALSSAAEGKLLEETMVQFDLTLRSCVSCHYSFAKEKFPDLAKSEVEF